MNSFKSNLKSELGNPTYDLSFDVLHKKCVRHARRKKVIISISSFCVIAAIFTFFGNFVSLISDRSVPSGFTVTVYAADETDSAKALTDAQSVVSYQSHGVYKKEIVSSYNENGELDSDKGTIKLKHYSLDCTPIVFNIEQLDKGIESFDISCGDNGNLSTGNMSLKTDYKDLAFNHIQQVLWYPSFKELNSAVSKAIGKDTDIFYKHDYEEEKNISQAINALLQTKDDYNRFFADTVNLTVHYEDGKSESCKANISLDKDGFYMVKYI